MKPTTLTGTHVRLEPYAEEHILDLWAIGQDPSLWEYMPFPVRSQDEMGQLVRWAIQMADSETGLGFIQRAVSTGEIVGGTSYLNPDAAHRRVEIGATWLTPAWQRTAVNTEAKLLLLGHAFEVLRCIRVEFKTDSLNQKSCAALARIGAVEEGTFRNHMIMPDGRYRHSTYFSITDDDWASVRDRLTARLEQA